MFLRFAASSSSGPAVARLRMMANTWLFGSADFGRSVSGHVFVMARAVRLTRLSIQPNCDHARISTEQRKIDGVSAKLTPMPRVAPVTAQDTIFSFFAVKW